MLAYREFISHCRTCAAIICFNSLLEGKFVLRKMSLFSFGCHSSSHEYALHICTCPARLVLFLPAISSIVLVYLQFAWFREIFIVISLVSIWWSCPHNFKEFKNCPERWHNSVQVSPLLLRVHIVKVLGNGMNNYRLAYQCRLWGWT